MVITDERCGNLIMVLNDSSKIINVVSQLEIIIRETWSNPPAHGARVIATVMKNPALYAEWYVVSCFSKTVILFDKKTAIIV